MTHNTFRYEYYTKHTIVRLVEIFIEMLIKITHRLVQETLSQDSVSQISFNEELDYSWKMNDQGWSSDWVNDPHKNMMLLQIISGIEWEI